MKVKIRKNILLVEDEILIAMGKQQELEKYGYTVQHVNTGKKAVALSKDNNEIDLILMDIDLGRGIDGTEAAALILEEHSIPIVFMSSHTEPEIVEKTEKITSYGYVVKSSSITVLDASIKMAFKLFNANKKILEGRDLLQKTVDGVNDPILLIDKDFRVLMSNKAVKDNYDYNKEFCYQISHDQNTPCDNEDHPCVLHEVFETKQTIKTQHIHTNKKGEKHTVELIVTPLFEDGKLVAVIETSHDITEHLKFEELLLEREEHFRDLYLNAPIGYQSLDKNGNFIEVNPVLCELLGYKKEELIGKPFTQVLDKETAREIPGRFSNFVTTGRIDGLSFDFMTKSGKVIPTEIDGRIAYDDQGNFKQTHCIIKDITKHNQEKDLIRSLYNKNKAIIEAIPDIIMEVDENKVYTWANEAGYSFFGNDVIGKEASYYFKGEQETYDLVSPIFEGSEDTIYIENWQHRKDGQSRLLAWWCKALKDLEGTVTGTISIARDITDSRHYEEILKANEERYHQMFENTNAVKLIIDPSNGQIRESNTAAQIFYGYDKQTLNSMKITEINLLPDYEVNNEIQQAKMGKKNLFNFRHRLATGEIRNVEVYSGPVLIEGESLLYSIIHDVTDRKLAENLVKRQLEEKEIILKEVHHRIKNNIASIGSLLFLQAQSTDSPEVQSALQDAIGRVNSMQVLYEKLLLTDNYQVTSAMEYLTNLIDQIIDLFPDNIGITVEKQIDDFQLDSKRLIPMGIIVNELLTNIIKYAFTVKNNGLIQISLTENNGNVILTIQDNGEGLPTGFDIDTQTGFGLMLVKMLSEQLDGNFTIKSNNGTKSTLKFLI